MKRYKTLLFVSSILCLSLELNGQEAEQEFEVPPVFSAASVLKEEWLRSRHHQVLESVATQGVTNTYLIKSAFGNFQADGDDLLRIRVREIRALAAMQHIAKSKLYGDAAKQALQSPLKMAGNLLESPGNTVRSVGRGAMRYVRRAGEAVKRGKVGGGSVKDLIGLNGVKRELAFELGVDPYSRNPALQRQLDELAWTAYAGKMTVKVAMTAIPAGTAGSIVQGASTSSAIKDALKNKAPLDLRRENREVLERMGIAGAEAAAFLDHPVYTPSSQTIITRLLAQLGGAMGRGDFLRMAITAQDEADSLFFVRVSQLMANYQKRQSEIRQVMNFNGLPICLTNEGTLVVPLACDYGAWSGETAALTEAIVDFQPQGHDIKARHLYLTGALSERAKREIQRRGFQVLENAFGKFWK